MFSCSGKTSEKAFLIAKAASEIRIRGLKVDPVIFHTLSVRVSKMKRKSSVVSWTQTAKHNGWNFFIRSTVPTTMKGYPFQFSLYVASTHSFSIPIQCWIILLVDTTILKFKASLSSEWLKPITNGLSIFSGIAKLFFY